MVDRVKLFLTRSLITVQKLLVLSDTARTHVGGPKLLANAVDDDMADTKHAPTPHALPYQIWSL